MKLRFLSFLLVCLLGVAGCSTVSTEVERGTINASTYSLMRSKAPATVTPNERRQAVHQKIQQAIVAELGKKGLKQVPSGGELQIAYMVIVADNATTATYDEYFGYGRDGAALSQKAHKTVMKSGSRERFEIGAIVIDVVNAKDGKVLYRNVAHMDVSEVTPDTNTEPINVLVGSALGNLSVSP
jgi:hypothetical protein